MKMTPWLPNIIAGPRRDLKNKLIEMVRNSLLFYFMSFITYLFYILKNYD